MANKYFVIELLYMYETNLFIATIFLPLLSYFFIRKVSRQIAAIILSILFSLGLLFTYATTEAGYSFENNVLDIFAIHFFLLSIFGWVSWISSSYQWRSWKHIFSLFTCSLAVFIIFNACFGPSEACGQSFPEKSKKFDTSYKLTHSGYQYGLMDYGSRFIIYRTKYGIEKIVGLAENANEYYQNILELQLDTVDNVVVINYRDYRNVLKIHKLHIQKPRSY